MILLLDNYDSFVHNLARYFRVAGAPTRVVRSDAIDAAGVQELAPRAIVISPGPCGPDQAGCSLDVVRRLTGRVPILGVCLGAQAIGQALGARVRRAARPVHGQASLVTHTGEGPLAGLPSPLRVGRYHSLIVEEATLPTELRAIAWSETGELMGVAHRTAPTFGLQFHPESILTDRGDAMVENFLRIAAAFHKEGRRSPSDAA
ncbi:Aminodeoxychorismate synthase component 2 [Pirellulimonas nuda]|uniref:Aminodeoxychorismate synthase component 2 n=1 Tax=Pirellulimonas nuda TaxID=2528009 RepID=A0A518DEJ5_9BACT|nr:aminodeoxychorismate/anthranilate synthase component II [Pirellulimonas nuda]QDU89893.1 Aminodeoxychorismate synthase component 2 [Pirellulimonas nuda]